MGQPEQQQEPPGTEREMDPVPDHGEHTYRGSGRLAGKAAVITGADSGIGKAVAIAFAREGADVLISYLSEHDDAEDTWRWVEEAGRKAVLVPGDLADPAYCRAVIASAVEEFGRVDILVSNAAFQMTHELDEISDKEWDYTLAVNLPAMFHLCKAAIPHMPPGSSIIGTSSVNSDSPTLPRSSCWPRMRPAISPGPGSPSPEGSRSYENPAARSSSSGPGRYRQHC